MRHHVRYLWLATGIISILLGAIGLLLPIMPTVPFMILAAFCFARSNPEWEAWLLDHAHFGPHIRAWRERGAISLRGKQFAVVGLCGSAVMGMLLLEMPWALAPSAIALVCGTWIATRPTA
jgi:uncharacterized membrane protein YbaN (DUF454 family)